MTNTEPVGAPGAGSDEQVDIVRGPDGRATFLPAGARGLKGQALTVWTDLLEAADDLRVVQEAVDEYVIEARNAGLSWATIGWAVGMTSEGARKRWTPTP
jgi:hypothetical protein